MIHYTMKELPKDLRPRERLMSQGERAMSHSELLAILLGSGVQGKTVLRLAEELLFHFGSLRRLADASISELMQIPGVGPAKAIQLRAVFALANRLVVLEAKGKPPIVTPEQAYQEMRFELEGQKEERIVALLHDIKGRSLGCHLIGIGTVTRALTHPREIFYPAIRNKAVKLTLGHNHPSGDPTPSGKDLLLTRRLVAIGKLLEIPFIDHLVIGAGQYVSIRELWKQEGVGWD